MLELEGLLDAIAADVRMLLDAPAVPLGEATPPPLPGVYMAIVEGGLTYVGQTRSSKGLRDRLGKHISGDESHAMQRELAERFPDRLERRAFMRANVHVRWVVIPDPDRAVAVERVLLCLQRPTWNRD